MKNKVFLFALPLLLLSALSGCKGNNYTKVKEIYDNSRVFEVYYDKVDYKGGNKFWADNNDNWGGGCSAITKNISNHRVVGRNMDLNLSEKAAYIVRTGPNEKGYKTIGLAYTFRDYALDYEVVKNKGITSEFKTILPFLCDDVMNDQGLHIEVNMRHAEMDFSGYDQFSLKGTNPGKERVHMFELPRYIAERCSTVEQAKNLINNELDIYSKNGYWDYCFIISDSNAEGTSQHSSLLEFSAIGDLGELYNSLDLGDTVSAINWIDEEDVLNGDVDWLTTGVGSEKVSYEMNALAQTNFYINKWAFLRQDVKSGEGRFITMQKLINNVNSKDDMYDLMRRISYGYFYNAYDDVNNYHFDPRSENLGEFQGGTYNFLFSDDQEVSSIVKSLLDEFLKSFKNMTRQEKINDGTIWESTFTEVVDVTDRTIEVRFFENESLRFLVDFNQTTHLTPKEEKGVTDWTPLN